MVQRIASRLELDKAFGRQKFIQKWRANEKNRMPTQSSASGESGRRDATASAVLSSMAVQLPAKSSDSNIRPKPNINAESVDEVYKLEDLIGLDVLQAIDVKDWKYSVKAKRSVETPSLFVSSRIEAIVNSSNRLKLKALKYLLACFQWLQSLTPGPDKTMKQPPLARLKKNLIGVEDFVLDSIVKKFASAQYVHSPAFINIYLR